DIDLQTLELAESEWLARQGEERKRQEFNLYRRSRFKKHFGRYAITNSFLMLFNFVAVGHLTWSLYLVLLWGLGLGLNAWNTFQSDGEEYERAFQQWYRRYQFKETVNSFFDKLLKTW
ncbi:MAG TPA: 2TM domain-containing protein, partial [Phormidium sp.]